jgi:peptidoglycan/xylan/chitin deacetylase (PgdA/CDA1 family)
MANRYLPSVDADTRTLIVNYHYCLTPDENPYLARTAISPERFERHMRALAEASGMEFGAPATGFLVTFDDGTRDIYRNAVPILQRYGIPAILFVCSQPLVDGRLLNVTKIHMLQAKLGLEAFRSRFMAALDGVGGPIALDDPERIGLGRIYRYDDEETRQFKLLLNVRLPTRVVTTLLDKLFDAEFGAQAEVSARTYLSIDDIARCRDVGIEIGLHTHSHTMLGKLSLHEQREEITRPLEFFREHLDLDEPVLSYPYGIAGTWNADTKSILTSCGIPRAYTLGRALYDPRVHQDPLEIPRFDVNDVFSRDDVLRPEQPV